MKRLALLALFTVISASPAHAQWPVTDPANLSKLIAIAKTAYDQYQTLRQQLARLEQMNARLQNIERYRTRAILGVSHDTGKYAFGAPMLQGLNVGDPRGDLLSRVLQPIPSPRELAALTVPPQARQTLERAYAGDEILRSFLERGVHNVGANRVFWKDMDQAIDALEDDVTRPANKEHYLTANMDKIAAGTLLARRQDTAINQLLATVVEQQLAKTKQLRESGADWMNAQIRMGQRGQVTNHAVQDGATDDLKNWRFR